VWERVVYVSCCEACQSRAVHAGYEHMGV
jgi:hypothetical protein